MYQIILVTKTKGYDDMLIIYRSLGI